MEKEELIKEAEEVIRNCDVYYLSTFNKIHNAAETRAIANIRAEKQYPQNVALFDKGDLSNYIVTTMSTDKITQIKFNPTVSLYFFCLELKKSLTLFGTAEILNDNELKNKLWVDEWTHYFALGVDDPEYTILKFTPKSVKYFPNMINKVIMEL